MKRLIKKANEQSERRFENRQVIEGLIDYALQMNDKEWFMELTEELKKFDQNEKNKNKIKVNNDQPTENETLQMTFYDQDGNNIDIFKEDEEERKYYNTLGLQAKNAIAFLNQLIVEYKEAFGTNRELFKEKVQEVESMVEQIKDFFDIV